MQTNATRHRTALRLSMMREYARGTGCPARRAAEFLWLPPAEALPEGRWLPVARDDYCPLTFDGGPQEGLCKGSRPTLVEGDRLYVYGEDGDNAHFYVFYRSQAGTAGLEGANDPGEQSF